MFYLIGGAPRSGKTILAKELSNRLSVPWISTDTLESVVLEYMSKDALSDLFPKSAMRQATRQSNDEMYTAYTPEEIADAYIKQGQALEMGIEIFLESESRYDHSYILEGYHISPSLVAKLKDTFATQSVFLGREDEIATREMIVKHAQHNDWVVAKTENRETYPRIAAMICEISMHLKREASQHGLTYISVDDNFLGTLEHVVADFSQQKLLV